MQPRGTPRCARPTISPRSAISNGQAKIGLARLTVLLHRLGLQPKPERTKCVQLAEGERGFDFLGFAHPLVSHHWGAAAIFLARWPSKRAMQHPRNRIRLLAMRAGCRTSRTGRCGGQELPSWLAPPYGKLASIVRQDQKYAVMYIALLDAAWSLVGVVHVPVADSSGADFAQRNRRLPQAGTDPGGFNQHRG